MVLKLSSASTISDASFATCSVGNQNAKRVQEDTSKISTYFYSIYGSHFMDPHKEITPSSIQNLKILSL